jgi:SET domain
MEAHKKNLEKRKTARGWALFSKCAFPKDTTIFEFEGPILKEKPKDGQYLQIGVSLYIGASGGLDDCSQHNCQPNAYVSVVGNRAFLKALHLIKAETEITFDYSTTSTESSLGDCNCGAYACRKTVGGFHTLDEKTKERYIGLGMVPEYLQSKDKK